MEMKLSKLLYIIILWSCFGDVIAVGPCDYEVKYKVSIQGRRAIRFLFGYRKRSAFQDQALRLVFW